MKLFLAEPFASKWHDLDPFQEVFSLSGEVYRDMGDRCTRRIELDGKAYFVKTHTGVGWIEIFKNLFSLRKPILGAENEYEAILKLSELGVKTMIVKAYGSDGWNPANKKSFIITEALEPTKSLDECCNPETLTNLGIFQRRRLVAKLAGITRTIHENGVNHRDYYLCHFLIDTTDGNLKDFFNKQDISLIDLHRVQIRKQTPKRWRHKDLSALHYSATHSGFNQRDALCFIREYNRSSLREALNEDLNFWKSVSLEAKKLNHKGIRKGYHN